MCEIHSCLFFVNFKHVSHYALVFPLLNLNKEMPVGNSLLLDSYLNQIATGDQSEFTDLLAVNSYLKIEFISNGNS